MHRVAIIFDDRTRPETTGVYCRRALATLTEVVFFHPEDLARIPTSGFDLYLVIDDGLDYALPAGLHPLVYWAIDTHIGFERSLARARQADFVFAAQRDGAERLRAACVESARWLPLACDAEIHGAEGGGEEGKRGGGEEGIRGGAEGKEIGKQYEICFVGNLIPGVRYDLVRLLRQFYPEMYVGNAYFQDMARIYSASKIVFNRSVLNDLNMRVFEALASGPLLVTNVLAGNDPSDNGQAELFREETHLVAYRTSEDLLERVRYYLEHDEERERIAAAGRQEVLARHTYRHRMEEMLRVVTGAICRQKSVGSRQDEVSGQVAVGSGQEEVGSGQEESAERGAGRAEREDASAERSEASAELGARSAEREEASAERGTRNLEATSNRSSIPNA
jgi:O-antigen biosynthesis protein